MREACGSEFAYESPQAIRQFGMVAQRIEITGSVFVHEKSHCAFSKEIMGSVVAVVSMCFGRGNYLARRVGRVKWSSFGWPVCLHTSSHPPA